MTDVYNRFHDPADTSHDIEAFRALHRELDIAVLNAFDWGDLDLELDFREVPYLPESDRVRLTVSERVRTELLRRLTDLNHRRHAEEMASNTKNASRMSKGMMRSQRQDQLALEIQLLPAESSPAPASTGKRRGTHR